MREDLKMEVSSGVRQGCSGSAVLFKMKLIGWEEDSRMKSSGYLLCSLLMMVCCYRRMWIVLQGQ